LEGAESVEDVSAESALVGQRRSRIVDAAVDLAVEVFDELAEDVAVVGEQRGGVDVDLGDDLAGAHWTGSRTASGASAGAGGDSCRRTAARERTNVPAKPRTRATSTPRFA
jgi:hypothetical protein